jgi:hypothetical protein
LHLLVSWIESASCNSKVRGGGGGRGKVGRRGKGGGAGGGVRAAGVSAVIDLRDIWGRTALHWASINGHAVTVQALLDAGANDGIKDGAGESALEMAERRARCGAKERNSGEFMTIIFHLRDYLMHTRGTRYAEGARLG